MGKSVDLGELIRRVDNAIRSNEKWHGVLTRPAILDIIAECGYEKRNTEIDIILDEGAIMPERAYEYDAGLDLKTPQAFYLFPGARMVVDTLVHVNIPNGYVGYVKSKSGLMVKNGILTDGTVDAGYTGSVRVCLFNLGEFGKEFKAGDKIAQLVIQPIETPTINVVKSFDEETERGDNGFGSSGR